MDFKNIKTRQHYVPKAYLKYWKSDILSSKGAKSGVFALFKKENKIGFCTNLSNISQEKFFYQLNIDDDVYAILNYRYKNRGVVAEELLKEFHLLSVVEKYKENKELNYEGLDVININYLENKYEIIERKLNKTLESINNNLYSYLNSIKTRELDFKDLIGLFFTQHFRTNVMLEKLDDFFGPMYIGRGDERKELTDEQKRSYLRSSIFLESMLSVDDFLKEKFCVELLINNSNNNFISSDSPAIFIGDMLAERKMSNFVGYMPLSPRIGMCIFGYKKNEKNLLIREADAEEVFLLNHRISSEPCDQLYFDLKISTKF